MKSTNITVGENRLRNVWLKFRYYSGWGKNCESPGSSEDMSM